MASADLVKKMTESQLQCSLCKERYNQPKALDCTHSFCQKCLVKYYKDAQKMPCPECEKETVLPEEGVPGLKPNLYLESFLEKFSSLQMTDESSAMKPREDAACEKHQGSKKLFFCVPCEMLICRDCTVIDHPKPDHHYVDCAKAANERRKSAKQFFPEYEREIEVCQHSLQVVLKAMKDLKNNVATAMSEVHVTAAEIIAKVKEEEDCMITAIKSQELDRATRLMEQEKKVTGMLQSRRYSLEVAEDAMENCCDSTFLEIYPEMPMLFGQHVPQLDRGLSCLSFKRNQTSFKIVLGEIDVEGKWEKSLEFGEVKFARGIAALSDQLAVTDHNHGVQFFSREGQHNTSLSLGSNIHDIAALNNRLIVVDNTKIVKVYNGDGSLAFDFTTVPIRELGKANLDLKSVAVKKDGNIIVGDVERNVLTEHSPTDGSLIHTILVKTAPFFLASDCTNNRVVVSGGLQHEVDIVDGGIASLFTLRPTINSHQVKYCRGVCCDSSGMYVLICNGAYDTGHIHRYDAKGKFLGCIAQDLHNPSGITFTSDGQQLAVADCTSIKMFHKV
ncbi:tripartite motif-containing protein 35-like [Asterias rubens]|uniref:tripartite motif-containing protein 35-like n=1 Tax=Asterias rubens TaxID=7604 RepID=UPI00145589DA|nr:tripartite motif-containing protein 35-like [Asterias rubens]